MVQTLKDKYEKMNTRQLLAEYRGMRFNYTNYDMYEEEYIDNIEEELKIIKTELDTREHIPNKEEAKKIRQENAKKGR